MAPQRLLPMFAAVFACALGAINAHASIIASDDFEDYTATDPLHTLNGGTGFTGAWVVNGTQQPDVTVVSGGLTYNGGDISVTGGSNAMQYAANDSDTTVLAYRPMQTTSSDVVYFSFLYQQSAQVGVSDFMQIGLHDAANQQPTVSALDRESHHQLRSTAVTENSVDTGIDTTTGQTYLVVLKAEKTGGSSTYNDISMYVDPKSRVEGFNVVDAVSTVDSGLDLSSNAFLSFRKAFTSVGDNFLYDNIVVSDTFADAVGASGFEQPDYAITTATGVGADAYVQSGTNAENEYGALDVLRLKNAGDPNFHRKTYLKFDVSGVQGQVTDAIIELTVQGFAGNPSTGSWSFDVFGLVDGHAGESWTDAAINWNNAPGNDDSGGSMNLADAYGGAALASFTLDGAGPIGSSIQIDAADFPDLLAFLNADSDGMVTFIITRATAEADGDSTIVHQLYSKEGAGGDFAPRLLLNAIIPEPTSLAMLGLAGAALLRRRSRG